MHRGFSLHATIATASLALLIGAAGFFSFADIQNRAALGQVSLVTCAVPITPPDIRGSAGYAVNLKDGEVLFNKNADAQLPLASVTKVMTGILALDMLTPDAIIEVSPDALFTEGLQTLLAWERWRARDLLNFMLVTSSNQAARALAIAATESEGYAPEYFVSRMNQKAQDAGLVSMYFLNETGLDVSQTVAGAYGSARDVAHLLALAVREYPLAAAASADSARTLVTESGFTRTAEHTSVAVSTLPGAITVKTGYTDLAGGNLAAVIEQVPGHPIAIAILGSTREARHIDVIALAEYAKRVVALRALCRNN